MLIIHTETITPGRSAGPRKTAERTAEDGYFFEPKYDKKGELFLFREIRMNGREGILMRTYSKNNSKKKGNSLFGKRSFLLYGLLALVVVTAAAAAVQIIPGADDNSAATGDIWAGTGAVDNPYQISSVEDLTNLAIDVNSGNPHSGEWFILTKDLDLSSFSSGAGWTPIGNDPNCFEGNFDGNGHTISNLFIDETTVGNNGLFGLAEYCIIMNLGVVNANVSGFENVGGLIGSVLSNCTIENCYVTGTGTVTGTDSVGGVVGWNGDNSCTVENCYNTGAVSGSSSIGGVVGQNDGTMKNCYNTGVVTLTGGGNNTGGVVSINFGTVENCYNTGDVTVTGGGGNNTGGVVGQNDGDTVKNCYNTGDVTGSVGDNTGGVVGWNEGGTVENCYNIGDVYGNRDVGGVVGNNSDTVENCYNTGSVNGGGNNVGGVVGWNNGGTVENCYNIGDFNCGGDNTGGVVGNNDNGTVKNCYNTRDVNIGGGVLGGVAGLNNDGIIENCYNTGDVSGSGSVGGVAGNNSGTVKNCYNTGGIGGGTGGGVAGYNSGSGTVENCYNTGDVSGTIYVGGVVGDGKSNNCFFLDSVTLIGIGGGGTGATPISDTNMKLQSTFTGAGWDFDGISGAPPVWFMLDNVTYPMLFWQIADSGSGADTDPYDVTTIQQMENIQNVFVAHDATSNASDKVYWQLGNDIDATGYFAVGGPGYNSGAGWVPIGDSTNPFEGSFDGSGYTITGLFIYTGNNNVGMFGYVNVGGKIMNLGLVNVNITGGGNVGGVTGRLGGSAENCYVTGTISGSGSNVGGVVGFNVGGMINNCYNTSDVTLKGSGSNVGGVVGNSGPGTVENCYNTGDVTITNTGSVGGVVGWNNIGTVENCYNTGVVTGNDYHAVGGVVSNNSGTVENCFFLQSQQQDEINYGIYGISNTMSNIGAEPIGDTEMRTEDTFTNSNLLNTSTGWDFDSIWGIYLNGDASNLGYGFPFLMTIGNNILVTPDGGSKVYDGNPAPIPTWTSDVSYDPSLFTGSLSYDPMPAVDARMYNITLGTLDSPYYQVRFQDDVQYEITKVSPEPPAPEQPSGVSYTITASSDTNSSITPSGQVSVQGGTNKTFTYSAASGYHISSVTVNGKDLTQDIITGSFTFTNVVSNNSIAVKSALGSPITLTITVVQGSGYAEYSVNGSDFVRYVSPVPLNVSDSVTVRANAGDGYSFVKWETPSTETNSEVTLTATSSLSLKAYFSESGSTSGNSSNSNLWIWVLAVIIVLIIIFILIWYLIKIKK